MHDKLQSSYGQQLRGKGNKVELFPITVARELGRWNAVTFSGAWPGLATFWGEVVGEREAL